MQIMSGPFKGTTFTQDQAYAVASDRENELPKACILMSALTQVWLDKYDPSEGWSTIIECELTNLNMVPRARENMVVTEHVPCAKFIAKLTNPQDKVVATASSVWTIMDPGSWEQGETNVRKRLYEAGGLQTKFPLPEGMVLGMPSVSIEGAIKVRDPAALPDFKPVVDDTLDPAAGAAEDPAPVVVEQATSAAKAPVPGVSEAVVEVGAADPAGSKAPADPAASVATAEASTDGSSSNAQTATRGRARRERLPDDAPAPQALIDQVSRLAKLKGKPVPMMVTKGDATKALQSLQA